MKTIDVTISLNQQQKEFVERAVADTGLTRIEDVFLLALRELAAAPLNANQPAKEEVRHG